MYTEGETMQLSPTMNELLNLKKNYIFDKSITLTVPKSNFIPSPTPPPPTPIIVDPDKFTYVLCDLIEPQILGGSLIPALAVLPRGTNIVAVREKYNPVSFLTPRRQLVSSVTIRLVDRNLNPLPLSKETSVCTLKFQHE
jgi:hypothetical protein